MALQDYTKADIFLNGVLIAEATGITVNHRPGKNPVNTMNKGFAGFSPGSASMEVQIESAVPRVGTDMDFVALAYGNTTVDIVFFGRSKKMKSKGQVTDASERYGTDQPASFSLTLVCSPPEESSL